MRRIKPIFVENLELIISSGLEIPPIKLGHELIFDRNSPAFGRTGLKLTGIACIDDTMIRPLIEGTLPEPTIQRAAPPRNEAGTEVYRRPMEFDDDDGVDDLDDIDDLWEKSIFVPFNPIEDPPQKG